MTAGEWAAWVQAVGTILAFVGAIWLSSREDRRVRKEAEEHRRQAYRLVCESALAMAEIAQDRLLQAWKNLRANHGAPELRELSRSLALDAEQLRQFPAYQLRHARPVSALLGLVGVIGIIARRAGDIAGLLEASQSSRADQLAMFRDELQLALNRAIEIRKVLIELLADDR